MFLGVAATFHGQLGNGRSSAYRNMTHAGGWPYPLFYAMPDYGSHLTELSPTGPTVQPPFDPFRGFAFFVNLLYSMPFALQGATGFFRFVHCSLHGGKGLRFESTCIHPGHAKRISLWCPSLAMPAHLRDSLNSTDVVLRCFRLMHPGGSQTKFSGESFNA